MINSLLIFNPICSEVKIGIILLNFIDITIVAIINNTKANPALIINTGILKKVFNSFFMRDFVWEFCLITKLSIFSFLWCVVVMLFNLELILK